MYATLSDPYIKVDNAINELFGRDRRLAIRVLAAQALCFRRRFRYANAGIDPLYSADRALEEVLTWLEDENMGIEETDVTANVEPTQLVIHAIGQACDHLKEAIGAAQTRGSDLLRRTANVLSEIESQHGGDRMRILRSQYTRLVRAYEACEVTGIRDAFDSRYRTSTLAE